MSNIKTPLQLSVMTTNQLVEFHNSLGGKTLKSWKASKVDLIKRIMNAQANNAAPSRVAEVVFTAPAERVAKIRAAATSKEGRKNQLRTALNRALPLPTTEAGIKNAIVAATAVKNSDRIADADGDKAMALNPKIDPSSVSVADIARSFGMSPKVARAKLRRAGVTHQGTRYAALTVGSKAHTEICDLLRPTQK